MDSDKETRDLILPKRFRQDRRCYLRFPCWGITAFALGNWDVHSSPPGHILPNPRTSEGLTASPNTPASQWRATFLLRMAVPFLPIHLLRCRPTRGTGVWHIDLLSSRPLHRALRFAMSEMPIPLFLRECLFCSVCNFPNCSS